MFVPCALPPCLRQGQSFDQRAGATVEAQFMSLTQSPTIRSYQHVSDAVDYQLADLDRADIRQSAIRQVLTQSSKLITNQKPCFDDLYGWNHWYASVARWL